MPRTRRIGAARARPGRARRRRSVCVVLDRRDEQRGGAAPDLAPSRRRRRSAAGRAARRSRRRRRSTSARSAGIVERRARGQASSAPSASSTLEAIERGRPRRRGQEPQRRLVALVAAPARPGDAASRRRRARAARPPPRRPCGRSWPLVSRSEPASSPIRAVPVVDQVVDEQLDARRSCRGSPSRHRRRGARCRRTRTGSPRQPTTWSNSAWSTPTVASSSPSTRWRRSVFSAATSPSSAWLAVHQHHAVAGLLERALGALERRRVERARDVGDDEADRQRALDPQRAGQLGGLEVQLVRGLAARPRGSGRTARRRRSGRARPSTRRRRHARRRRRA